MAGALSDDPLSTAAGDPSRVHKWVLLVTSAVSLAGFAVAAVRETVLAEWIGHQKAYAALLRASAPDERAQRAAKGFRVEIRQVAVPGLRTVDRCVSCHAGIENPRMADQPQPHRAHSGDTLKVHPVAKFGCTSCHRGQGSAVTFAEAKGDTPAWHDPMLPRELTQASCGSCHEPESLAGRGADQLALGARLFREQGCRSCHQVGRRGGALGPGLDRAGLKSTHELTMAHLRGERRTWNWHAQHLKDPAGIVPGSRMPIPQLTERQRMAVTTYVLSLQARDLARSYTPDDRVLAEARSLRPGPADGKQLYREFCRSCHGDGTYTRWDKKALRFIPAIRGQSLVRLAGEDYLKENLRQGRPGTEMPAWHERAGGLSLKEQEALVAYLREGHATRIPRTAPAGGSAVRGRALFAQQCAGCHGSAGRDGIAPALALPAFQKAASDSFLAATIADGRVDTPMPAFQPPGGPGLTDSEIAELIAHIRSLAAATATAPRTGETHGTR